MSENDELTTLYIVIKYNILRKKCSIRLTMIYISFSFPYNIYNLCISSIDKTNKSLLINNISTIITFIL